MKPLHETLRGLWLVLPVALLTCASCAPKQPKVPVPQQPEQIARPLPQEVRQWAPLILRLEQRGFDRSLLVVWFADPQLQFDPSPMRTKLTELMRLHYNRERTKKIQQALLTMGFDPGPVDGLSGLNTRRAIQAYQQARGALVDGEPDEEVLRMLEADLSRPRSSWPTPPADFIPPSEAPAKPAVYEKLLTPEQLRKSVAFYREHRALLETMRQRYGVPPELAVGIFTVETRLGEFLGGRKAFNTLASMALASDYGVIRPYLETMPQNADEEAFLREKAAERGAWAFDELEALLLYARRGGHDPLTIPGSVYGAIGMGQFMPSNAVSYGVDGDADGKVDLFVLEDAVMSFGNFMRAAGWHGDMNDPERRRKALMRYNRSTRYVNTVLAVADYVRSNGAE